MNDYDVFDEVFAEDDEPKTTVNPAEEPEEDEVEAPIEPGGHAETDEGEAEGNSEEQTQDQDEEVDYKALYEKAEQRFKSFEGRYRKEKEAWERAHQAPQPAPAREEPKEAPQADPEDEFLAKFRSEYNDDVLKALEIVSTRKARELLSRVEAERIEPLQQAYAKTAQEAHFNTIRSAHADWEDVVTSDDFTGWVERQPGFLRSAYSNVLERGTARDVVDLLSTYKEMTKPAAPAAPTKTNIDPAKVRAASAVKTSRGVMPSASSAARKSDFDSAWDEAPD